MKYKFHYICQDGSEVYYDEDSFRHHREDGPALIEKIIDRNGNITVRCSWYYHGTKVDCFSQEEFEKWLKLKAFW